MYSEVSPVRDPVQKQSDQFLRNSTGDLHIYTQVYVYTCMLTHRNTHTHTHYIYFRYSYIVKLPCHHLVCMSVCTCVKISKLCSLSKFDMRSVLLTILIIPTIVLLIWFIPFTSPGFYPVTQALLPSTYP